MAIIISSLMKNNKKIYNEEKKSCEEIEQMSSVISDEVHENERKDRKDKGSKSCFNNKGRVIEKLESDNESKREMKEIIEKIENYICRKTNDSSFALVKINKQIPNKKSFGIVLCKNIQTLMNLSVIMQNTINNLLADYFNILKKCHFFEVFQESIAEKPCTLMHQLISCFTQENPANPNQELCMLLDSIDDEGKELLIIATSKKHLSFIKRNSNKNVSAKYLKALYNSLCKNPNCADLLSVIKQKAVETPKFWRKFFSIIESDILLAELIESQVVKCVRDVLFFIIEEMMNETSKELKDLICENDSKAEELKNLQVHRDKIVRKMNKKIKKLKSLKTENNRYEETNNWYNSELSSLKAMLSSQWHHSIIGMREFQEKRKIAKDQDEIVKIFHEKNEELIKSLQIRGEEIDLYETEIKADQQLEPTIEKTKEEINTLEDQIYNLKNSVEKTKAKIESCQAESTINLLNHERSMEKLKERQIDVETAQTELLKWKSEYEEKRQQIKLQLKKNSISPCSRPQSFIRNPPSFRMSKPEIENIHRLSQVSYDSPRRSMESYISMPRANSHIVKFTLNSRPNQILNETQKQGKEKVCSICAKVQFLLVIIMVLFLVILIV